MILIVIHIHHNLYNDNVPIVIGYDWLWYTRIIWNRSWTNLTDATGEASRVMNVCLCSRNNWSTEKLVLQFLWESSPHTNMCWSKPEDSLNLSIGHWLVTVLRGTEGVAGARSTQKRQRWAKKSCKFMIFPIFSCHYASLCFTVTSTQQSSAPIGLVFSAKQITDGHERNIGTMPSWKKRGAGCHPLGNQCPSSLQVVLWLFPGFQNMSLQLDNK